MTIASDVRFLLADNPLLTPPDLYKLLNAVTVKEKATVRRAKCDALKLYMNQPNYKKARSQLPQKKNKNKIEREFIKFTKKCFPYNNIWKWQYELFKHLEQNFMSLVIVPRDHGKSVLLVMWIEYLLEVKKMDILLLGWTDRVKQMSTFVYSYFVRKGIVSNKITINTTKHFVTDAGIKFDCYGVRDKAVLGMHPDIYEGSHGLVMIIDDPMDESFETNPSKERDLEYRWESTLANINPTKIVICGTRKFEGDFLEYIGKRYKDTIAVFHRTPVKPDGTLLCPERWTLEKLVQKRAEIGEYRYSAEYMGDPQPITGGVWVIDDIHWASKLKKYSEYESIMISVDPAWTTNPTSDNTSIEIIYKGKEKEGRREYVVFDDISGKFTFSGILQRIDHAFNDHSEAYPNVNITVAIEINGGGKLLVEQAQVKNYAFAPYIIEVKNTRNKEERIMVLEVPIKNGTIKLMEDLKEKELYWEILKFPKGKKNDALDALAMGFLELEKMRRRRFMIRRAKWY